MYPPAKHGRHTVMSLSWMAAQFWFQINNFCRDASVLFKVYRRVKHCKIQVKFRFVCLRFCTINGKSDY